MCMIILNPQNLFFLLTSDLSKFFHHVSKNYKADIMKIEPYDQTT